ncbi:MAG: protein-L-isoaspartate(D-aspartate) O-methyltransferase, partial [bacterium]|nr:protein-L-isoaspartate(D-aspartate) O-methyltransferase [bacterium]
MTEKNGFQELRMTMVNEQIKARGIRDPRVLEIMGNVPREVFVPEGSRAHAYDDSPLAIGCGQTISQPYMVALMTELLELNGGEKVLEIGTGSGYQTRILAGLAGEVYTVERLEPLLERARETLAGLDIPNIRFKAGDGTAGWPENGPYDRILVTAGSPDLPEPLLVQLK